MTNQEALLTIAEALKNYVNMVHLVDFEQEEIKEAWGIIVKEIIVNNLDNNI